MNLKITCGIPLFNACVDDLRESVKSLQAKSAGDAKSKGSVNTE